MPFLISQITHVQEELNDADDSRVRMQHLLDVKAGWEVCVIL